VSEFVTAEQLVETLKLLDLRLFVERKGYTTPDLVVELTLNGETIARSTLDLGEIVGDR
jgi:hypothetical protein